MTASKSLRKIQTGPIRHRLSTEFIEKNGTLCASRRVKAEFYVITDTINRLIDGKSCPPVGERDPTGKTGFHAVDMSCEEFAQPEINLQISQPCTGNETLKETAEIFCTPQKMGVRLTKCGLENTKFKTEDMHMGTDESCRGTQVGETHEFVANSANCHVTPVVKESKLVYSSNIFGKAGMENSIINRFEFMKFNTQISSHM